MAQAEKPNLAQTLARIADRIGDREPIRHSRDIKFPFHSARDVYGWWRPLLQAEGIIIVPTVRTVDVQQVTLQRSGGGTRTTFLTTITCEFSLIDGFGEVITGSAVGQGEDPSDKGAGKAMTYAEKAFLLGMGMNGSEPDNELYSDDRRDESRDVVVEDSNITGIERGGRSTWATDVQIRRVRELAKEIGYAAAQTGDIVHDVLDIEVDLGEEMDEQGPTLIGYLERLTADDIGKVIQYMEGMREPAPIDESGY